MSSAFSDPPDSGVNVSASADGAATRRTSSAAASAASIRRRDMPVGKARGSYLRPTETLHFVRVAPSGLARGRLLDLQLAYAQAVDLELTDAQPPDHRSADRKPADRDGAHRDRAQGHRSRGQRPDRLGRWVAHSGTLEGRVALLEERKRALLEVTRAREAVLKLGLEGELAVEVRIEHPVQRALRPRIRAGGAGSEAPDQRACLVEQAIVRVDEVHEPPFERALSLDPLTQQSHLERPRLADGGGDEQRRSPVGHQADVHEGQAE